MDPSAFNPAWKQIFTAIGRHERDKALKLKRQSEVIDTLSKQNPLSYAVLSLRVQMVVESKDEKAARALISDLNLVQAKYGVENSLWATGLEFNLLAFCGLPSEILDGHRTLKSLDLVGRDTGVAKSMAIAVRTRIGDEALAERILTENLKEWDFDAEIYEELFYLLIDLGRLDEAGSLMARWAHHVTSGLMHRMKLRLLEAKGDHSAALELIKDRQRLVEKDQHIDEIYTLLCMASYSAAEAISRRVLEPIRFSAEASVEIINFELARKMLSKRPDTARLDAVRNFTSENATNAAIYCVLDKRSEMIGAIKAEFSCDKRFRYVFQRWPVFARLRADKEILAIFG